MDGSIGQAAFDQAKAFQDSVDVGAVIITKLDGHAKGGGALTTKSPIIFLGTGEHMDDFEPFHTQRFVSKLLGMGDMESLVKSLKEVVGDDEESQKELLQRIQQGQFSFRDMYDQFNNLLKMGPLNKVMENMPGMSQLMSASKSQGVDSSHKIKCYLYIMDSMTAQELDDPRILTTNKFQRESRIERIARGSGRSVREVEEIIMQFKNMQKMMNGMGKMKLGRGGQMNQRQMGNMANMIPPHLLKQMGGMGGIQNLMKQMGGM